MEKWPPGFRYRRVFDGPVVRISRWRCQGEPPRLGAERAQPAPLIVFSHSGNFRVHSPAAIGLLDCTRVGFFNALVPFQSAHPFGGGDSGSDLGIRPDVLAEIVARRDPAAAARIGEPFPFGSGPCDMHSFLLHRTLLRRVGDGAADAMEIEEISLWLADRLIEAAFRASSRPARHRANPREREEAEELRGILSKDPGARHTLDALSRRLESSPFRLCRSFRAVTGTTIHRHLTDLRMHQALGRLAEGSADLTDLALDLGFSSHSHFTAVFRKRFGMTPEFLRASAGSGNLAFFGGRFASGAVEGSGSRRGPAALPPQFRVAGN